jgi:membrane protease YdiL (CAAX protease family)
LLLWCSDELTANGLVAARAGAGAVLLGWRAAGLCWSTLRGHPNVWRIEGGSTRRSCIGTLAGLMMGLGIVFASRLSLTRFEWARALHRDLRHLLGPLPDSEIVVLSLASSLGEEIFFRGALMPVVG